MPQRYRPALDVLGVKLDAITLSDLLDAVSTAIDARDRCTIMYQNIHVANVAADNVRLRQALNTADIVYCDGMGIKWGARVLGRCVPERMTCADFAPALAEHLSQRGARLYWLGGQPGVAVEAMRRLRAQAPGLISAGAHHGFFSKSGAETAEVIGAINAACPDVVMVGFGTPIQETWVHENRAHIRAPVVWCVGAAADFIAGVLPRAPQWLARNGLEWAHRLYVEPRRMFRRYVVGNPRFAVRVARCRFARKGHGD